MIYLLYVFTESGHLNTSSMWDIFVTDIMLTNSKKITLRRGEEKNVLGIDK